MGKKPNIYFTEVFWHLVGPHTHPHQMTKTQNVQHFLKKKGLKFDAMCCSVTNNSAFFFINASFLGQTGAHVFWGLKQLSLSPPWLRFWRRRCCRERWGPPARDTPGSPRLLARSAPAPAEPAAPPDSSFVPGGQTAARLFSGAPEQHGAAQRPHTYQVVLVGQVSDHDG